MDLATVIRGGVTIALFALCGAGHAAGLDVKPGLWEIAADGVPEPQRACLTQELLGIDIANVPMPEGVECRNEIRESSATRVVSHTVCTGTFGIEGDTTVVVESPESMSMTSTSVMSFGPTRQTIDASARYRWLGADCGDVKPVDLKKGFE